MERIRELRNEKGLSQVKLAVMADMDPATLNRLEQGKGNPNLKTIARVADALGVEVVELFPKARAPLSFSRWLEERFGHSYLALSEEEIEDLFDGFSSREDEEERKRELFAAVHLEYLATAKTRDLPAEERVLVRGHHKEATGKWLLAQTASGQAGRITEEFEQSIKEALEAAAESETA